MRIAVIGQEEPVYFSPFLRSVIEARAGDVVLVVIAGNRGAGDHARTLRRKLENLYILWLIMEPAGFLRHLGIGLAQKLARVPGPRGASWDKRSIEGAARRHHIPVLFTGDLNAPDFVGALRRFAPDVVINQSELLLKKEVLAVPSIGFVNRHASLLPHFRGRLASWRSHAARPPEYGVTIHFVNEEIDAGPIILQKKRDIDPRSSYAKVLDLLFEDAPELMLEALKKLEQPGFQPAPNPVEGTEPYRFPTLAEVREYRRELRRRRKGTT